MTVFQNYREIFRVTDKGGALKTPIMKIGAGSNITITRPKDISGLYELDEVIISASSPGGLGSGQPPIDDVPRETAIVNRIEADSSTTKVIGIDRKFKLKDETLTFGAAFDASTIPSVPEGLTMFFHTVYTL